MILGMDISSNAEMICLANQEESGVRVRITEEFQDSSVHTECNT